MLDAELPEPEARGASVEAQAERHETSRELAALLDLLPDRRRITVVLRYVADLPIAEVTSVLGCRRAPRSPTYPAACNACVSSKPPPRIRQTIVP